MAAPVCGLVIGGGAAASLGSVNLGHNFEISYQQALALHLTFLPVIAADPELVLSWLLLVIGVSTVLLLGAMFLPGALSRP